MTSKRFPGKVAEMVHGDWTMLDMVVKAAATADVGEVILALPVGQTVTLHREIGDVPYRRHGSEHDVGSRLFHIAQDIGQTKYDGRVGLTHIVRLTGDCPLVDPNTIIAVRDEVLRTGHYAGRCDMPDGDDAEAFTFEELRDTFRAGPSEHVTTLMRAKHEPRPMTDAEVCAKAAKMLDPIRYSVNTPEDLERVRWLVKECGPAAGREAYMKACERYKGKA